MGGNLWGDNRCREIGRVRCVKKERSYCTSLLGAYQPDTSDKTRRFVEWLFDEVGSEGEEATELGRSDETGYRGLYAKEHHEEGEYLVAVPMDAALVIEEKETFDAERGRKFITLRDRIGGDGNSQSEAGNRLCYDAYLDVLPSKGDNFDPTPDFWDDDEIAALEFPRVVNEARARRMRVQEVANEEEDVALDELQLATWLVESRCFSMLKFLDSDSDDEQVETTCVIIPYLDMINHSSDNSNAMIQLLDSDDEDEDDDAAYFAVVATKDINPGDEVLLSYGMQEDSSVDLLLNYGFVPSTNKYDVDMFEFCEDDCFFTEEEWSTTLQEDEQRLQAIEASEDKAPIEETTLRFKIKLKRALREWKSS